MTAAIISIHRSFRHPSAPAIREATSPRAYHRARALILARSLGTRAAAAYLRNLGYRVEYALAILATGSHPVAGSTCH